jgi:hypothetical protein
MGDDQVVAAFDGGMEQLKPLLDRERVAFRRIAADRDDLAVEHFQPPLDHPEMTIGWWIKGAGVNRSAHGRQASGDFPGPKPLIPALKTNPPN